MIRITKAGPHPGERKGGNRKSPYGLLHKGFKFLVRLKRFELLAYRFVACCSIQLSYERPTTANIGKRGVVVKRFFAVFAKKRGFTEKKYFHQ